MPTSDQQVIIMPLPSYSHSDKKKTDHGFSLTELIVTVVIIGIIIAIAIPFFSNAQDSARQAAVDTAARDAQVLAQANIYQERSVNLLLSIRI